MNKRQFLKGMAATAAGIIVPGHVLSGQYEFHQRVPGLKALINSSDSTVASDSGVEWLGEVSSESFIDGSALSELINLTSGSLQNNNAGWLHVKLDGADLHIAKRPLRTNISWDSISSAGALYGNTLVNIKGVDYKIRLLKGANSDPASNQFGYDIEASWGSEWNRIFYRLHDKVHTVVVVTGISNDGLNKLDSEGELITLRPYSDSDLGFSRLVSGRICGSWCQERHSGSSSWRVYRGHSGVSSFSRDASSHTGNTPTIYEWRPVLEKVS